MFIIKWIYCVLKIKIALDLIRKLKMSQTEEAARVVLSEQQSDIKQAEPKRFQ